MGEGWVEVKPAPQGASEGTESNRRFLHLMADPEHLGGITPTPGSSPWRALTRPSTGAGTRWRSVNTVAHQGGGL